MLSPVAHAIASKMAVVAMAAAVHLYYETELRVTSIVGSILATAGVALYNAATTTM